jgi:hypothetical protein
VCVCVCVCVCGKRAKTTLFLANYNKLLDNNFATKQLTQNAL